MKSFAQLILALDQTTSTNSKVTALETYFNIANEADKVWAIALFTGKRPKRPFSTTILRKIAQELSGIPAWLFDESYHSVGDLAETIALLLPAQNTESKELTLTEGIALLLSLSKKEEGEIKEVLQEIWFSQTVSERFVFNKLITGGWRIGVANKLVTKALANHLDLDVNFITHRLMGDWQPATTSFNDLFSTEEGENTNNSRPYPFYLAYPIESAISELGDPNDWVAEWKWDGIRGQIIKRGGELFVWSRG